MAVKEVNVVVEELLQAKELTAHLFLLGPRMLAPDANTECLCSVGSE